MSPRRAASSISTDRSSSPWRARWAPVATCRAVGCSLAERAALIPSITILRSANALRFIDAKVPGIEVPPSIIERVDAAADHQEACFDLAYELASHALAQPGVAGLHFISFRKDAGIAKLCTRLGLEPRIEREKSLTHAHDA